MTENDKKDIQEALKMLTEALETEEPNDVPILEQEPKWILKWHDAKKENPPANEIDPIIKPYLCYNEVHKYGFIAYWCEKYKCFTDSLAAGVIVDYWMELPEPPKK